MKSTIAAVALAASAQAAFHCKLDDYRTVILAMAQGFQDDTTATDTDCYYSADAFSTQITFTKQAV